MRFCSINVFWGQKEARKKKHIKPQFVAPDLVFRETSFVPFIGAEKMGKSINFYFHPKSRHNETEKT